MTSRPTEAPAAIPTPAAGPVARPPLLPKLCVALAMCVGGVNGALARMEEWRWGGTGACWDPAYKKRQVFIKLSFVMLFGLKLVQMPVALVTLRFWLSISMRMIALDCLLLLSSPTNTHTHSCLLPICFTCSRIVNSTKLFSALYALIALLHTNDNKTTLFWSRTIVGKSIKVVKC